MSRFTLFALLLSILSFSRVVAQSSSYNQWTDHLPYNNCKAVVEAGSRIYSATPYSILYFDKTDNSINRLNKVTGGLSDIGISSIAYCSQLNTLVVAYTNTNIDLVKGSVVINIPDIKRKQILGNKTINSILVVEKLAYLACGFGIVVVDIEKEEIKDTYYIGASGSQINVNALTFHSADNKFYAATEKGMFSALATSNLAFYVNWMNETSLPGSNQNFNLTTSFAGKVYANKTLYSWASGDSMYVKNGNEWTYFFPNDQSPRTSMRVCGDHMVISCYSFAISYKTNGTIDKIFDSYNPGVVRSNDAIIDTDDEIWIADNDFGLWKIGEAKPYIFNGPASQEVTAMDISKNQLWAVPGGRTAGFGYLYKSPQCYTLANNKWSSFTKINTPEITSFRDLLCVAADPNHGNHAFIGSWGYGLLEFDNGELKQVYDTLNSTLRYHIGYGVGNLRVGGVAFDRNNNLWVTNSNVANVLSMRKSSGEWRSYNLGTKGTAIDVGGIVIDNENQKWLQLRDFALFVYNDNNTSDNIADDNYKKLTVGDGLGTLEASSIASMAVDRDGQLWIGTDQGVAVIYSPGNVFTQVGDYNAQQIMVEEEGFLHPLLETEVITAIAVNGNNEKWLGTDKAGAFLMSSDGTKELMHFTEANSPLLSNSIQSIKISETGEVYFGTSLGIVSYQDYKVAPPATLDSLIIYPNPVRPEYNGPIFISNLVAESNVKITDVSGALVWEIQAQGGRVIWNGCNLEGRRVNTGVYLVFVTNPDGSQKEVQKILFVH